MSSVAKIDWTMTSIDGGKALKIDYRVHNLSDHRIYLSDLLPMPGAKTWKLGKNEIIVMNGDEPGTVVFARARVRSETPLPFLVDPGARAVDPGKTATGSAEVPLPLQAQHYRGTVAPLKGKKTTAILELGYVSGDAHWEELPLDDGSKLTVSHPSDKMDLLLADPKPLPNR